MISKWIFAVLLTCTGFISVWSYFSKYLIYPSDSKPTITKIDSTNSNPNYESLEIEVDKYFDIALNNNAFPGAAVAIVKKDSLIYLNTFGKQNAGSNEMINSHSIFRLGSLSKGFHGLLTQLLVDKGCIRWDTNISAYLPELKLKNEKYQNEISISDLISHSAGFPYHTYTNLVEAGISLENIAKEFISISNLQEPGTQYSYQNAAFAMSQIAIERCTNQKYEELLKEYIFQPLNMRDASCTYQELSISDNIAMPQHFSNGQWKNKKLNHKYYNAISAGGINASITDMSHWMKLLLGNHPDILDQKSLENFFCPILETKTKYKYYQKWPNFENSYYSHGWRVHTFTDPNETKLDTLIHHGGQVNGYRNEIAISPDEDLAICVLFNNYTLMANKVIPEIMEIVRTHEQCEK